MGHDAGSMCMFAYVLIALACLFGCTNSRSIIASETGPQYETIRHSGRTLKASDREACEFGDTYEPYDEDCPNGATGLLPCNPGQRKVSECIGQGGDTSRLCEPCPQKFFQSSYNKCTACHPCSECGPNERIKEPCTDETDTICESIIPPPPPEPTTTRTDVTDATVPNPSTQPVSESTQGSTAAVSSEETTKNVPTTDVTVHTTQNISAPPPGRVRGNGPSEVTLVIGIIAAISWIVIIILVIALWITCRKWKEEQRKNSDLTSRLAALSNAVPSSSAQRLSEQGASVQSSRPNGSLRAERPVSDHEGSPEMERRGPVIDCPEDERSFWSKGLHSLVSLLPSKVVKDSHQKKRDSKEKASSRVTYHTKASFDSRNGRSTRDPLTSVTFMSLPKEDRTNLKKSEGTETAESLKGEGALWASEATPPVDRRASDDPHQGDGDGDSLVMNSVVHDGHPFQGGDFCDPSLGDGDNHGRCPGQDADHSNRSPSDDLHWSAEKIAGSSAFQQPRTCSNEWSTEVPPLDSDKRWHAEKVPGSFALPPTSTNSNISSTDVPPTDMPPLDSEVRWHAEKVPASFACPPTSANNKVPSVENVVPSLAEKVLGTSINQERGTQDPDIVTNAPLDNTKVEDHNPRTLRSSAEIPEAPIAEEEDLPEDNPEAPGANNDELDTTAATADPDRDVLQRLREPEAAVHNNNTTPLDGQMPEDANGRGKPWKKISFPFFQKQKRKTPDNARNQPAQQTQPLLTKMDNMVEEKCLDYVAGELKLEKLEKLCRELGLKDAEVENTRYELERKPCRGQELAFKMLLRIRELQGVRFTYGRLDRALRASSNVHVADDMVSKFQQQEQT